jgi:hypothetical protein
METLPDTQHRVSGTERELAIRRLQEAYIGGQLSDHELGERIDRALSAVVKLDLDNLVSDLPALPRAAPAAAAEAVRSPWWRRRKDGKVAKSKVRKDYDIYKSTVRKNGAWTVPALFQSRVYKSILILDLRQAVVSAHETVIELDAYKSRVAVIVPPDYNIELEVSAYKGSVENFSTGGLPGAPRLLIRGSAYKGSVVVANRDPDAPESAYPAPGDGR